MFKEYIAQVIRNSKTMATALLSKGYTLVSGNLFWNYSILVQSREKRIFEIDDKPPRSKFLIAYKCKKTVAKHYFCLKDDPHFKSAKFINLWILRIGSLE